jgi:hypothetical protein
MVPFEKIVPVEMVAKDGFAREFKAVTNWKPGNWQWRDVRH